MILFLQTFLINITEWLANLTWPRIGLGVLMFVVMFVVATGIVSFVVVKLPADYFDPARDKTSFKDRHPIIRMVGIIAKNLAGVVLILLGIVMSLPGVPGPGLVTILLGIMLLDFPGKHELEHKLVSRPSVLKKVNDLRKRFGKLPMKV